MPHTPPYGNAPLQLVVAEVRHPQSADLTRGEIATLKQQLSSVAPLQATDQASDFQIEVGPNGVPGPPRVRTREVTKFLTRDRRTTISFSNEFLSVETTKYVGWTKFQRFLDAALRARQDVVPVDGLTRLGLRYIDEIRIPVSIQPVPNWSEWVQSSLLAPEVKVDSTSLTVAQQQSTVQYRLDGLGETLALRYGAVDGPPAVQSAPHLLRPDVPPEGPYFLIDTDVAWTLADGEDLPELLPVDVMKRADRLHGPTKAVFESVITGRLREEVLK
ncbi:TIGR04255 family protein [Agromyces neolithicus]|uniref:TIGR04255 family protein n=1 Tax=Agromyces neolithicus TaxID=269420 RepID=UPI0031E24883